MVKRIVAAGMLLAALVLAAQPAGGAPGLPRVPSGPATAIAPPGTLGRADDLTLPNLAPLPPYDVYVGAAEHPQGAVWSNVGTLGAGTPPTKHALRFTTTIQNRARHSFELVGGPWVPDPAQPDLTTTHAYQCVRFTGVIMHAAQRNCARYDRVGTTTWHAQHRHFHINGFGRYELRRDAAGRPDMSKTGLVGKAQKTGWCVSDMWNWREDESWDEPGLTTDFFFESWERYWYQECTNGLLYAGASWRQGISPGWGDTYPAFYAGQEIPLRRVGDGVYWLMTTINPKDNEFGLRIQETTWADNTSIAKVQIYGGGTKARLLGPLPKPPYADWYANPANQPGH
jgi:hypothetical protein